MKLTGIYSIILGTGILLLWIMLLATGNVPELTSEPISIGFHLAAESLMGISMVVSGILILKESPYGKISFLVSSGLVIYAVINSAGYYGDMGDWVMVIMFMVILILSLLAVVRTALTF